MKLIAGAPATRGPLMFAEENPDLIVQIGDDVEVGLGRYGAEGIMLYSPNDDVWFLDADGIEEFIALLRQAQRALVADVTTIELPLTQ